MKFNKIFSYLAIGIATAFALSSCSDDNDSNPTLITPAEGSFKVNQPEFGANIVNLSPDYMTADDGVVLTWNQPKFTDKGAAIGNLAGSGITYRVMLSPTGKFTKPFDTSKLNTKKGIYEGDADFDYVIMDNAYVSTTSTILAKDINLNLNRWNQFSSFSTEAWQEGADCAPLKVYVMVQARIDAGIGNTVSSINSNIVEINVKPYYALPYEKPVPEPIYMPGNGNGWNHDYAPILKWSDDDDALVGYAYIDGEFKFTMKDNWNDGEYNCSNFDQAACSDEIVINDGTGNIGFNGEPSIYLLKVNIEKRSIIAEKYTWRLVGDFNSWNAADDSQIMTYSKDDHCLVFENATVTEAGWKFTSNGNWDVNYGGDLQNLSRGGDNITTAGSTIRLYLENTKKTDGKVYCTVE